MLNQKTIVLTGASSGLGRALAIQLAAKKNRLLLLGRNLEKLRSLEKECPDSKVLSVDLAKPDAYQMVLKEEKEPIDALIHCAGVSATGRMEDIPLSEFERCWHVNFLSGVSLIQQVLPQMKKRNQGLILLVSSGVAHRALPFVSPYASAKAALNSLTESMRVELAATDIKIVLFSPGPVATSFHDNIKHYGDNRLKSLPFHGETAEKIAQKLILAAEKNQKRVTIGTRAKIAKHLNYWSPHITDLLVERLYRIK